MCNLSNASVATSTAVLNPKVTSVWATSLSIVFGTPITFTPFKEKSLADFCVPSPPRVNKQSIPKLFKFSTHLSDTSSYTVCPSGPTTGRLNTLVLLEAPIIVPPLCNNPAAFVAESSFT